MTTTLPAPTLAPPAHRRATVPDPARLNHDGPHGCTVVESEIAYLAATWIATDDPSFRTMGRQTGRNLVADIHDDELIGLRLDLTHDTTAARLTVDDIADETAIYLAVALSPGVTYPAVSLYVAWVTTNSPHAFTHAAALAAAALRGWTHRQALAAGGAL